MKASLAPGVTCCLSPQSTARASFCSDTVSLSVHMCMVIFPHALQQLVCVWCVSEHVCDAEVRRSGGHVLSCGNYLS